MHEGELPVRRKWLHFLVCGDICDGFSADKIQQMDVRCKLLALLDLYGTVAMLYASLLGWLWMRDYTMRRDGQDDMAKEVLIR